MSKRAAVLIWVLGISALIIYANFLLSRPPQAELSGGPEATPRPEDLTIKGAEAVGEKALVQVLIYGLAVFDFSEKDQGSGRVLFPEAEHHTMGIWHGEYSDAARRARSSSDFDETLKSAAACS